MTSDMAFECLFVSRDSGLFRMIGRILRDLSISTSICLTSSKAFDLLGKGSADLIVIDGEFEESRELLRQIWKGGKWKKPTVVAISTSDTPLPGAHVVLKKPVTSETGAKCFKDAYSRMLIDYRRHVRHALMLPVTARFEDGREIPLVVTDIGDGGVGLSTKEELVMGDILSFRLSLPGAQREILVNVRVLWSREFGRAGCEFVRIPPVDLMILHEWLKSKSRVKKPITAE
jgi:PilZ domain